MSFHVFLDGSVLEVFVNGRAAATRIYPTRADSTGINVFGTEPRQGESSGHKTDLQLTSLDIWKVNRIWDGTEFIPG